MSFKTRDLYSFVLVFQSFQQEAKEESNSRNKEIITLHVMGGAGIYIENFLKITKVTYRTFTLGISIEWKIYQRFYAHISHVFVFSFGNYSI